MKVSIQRRWIWLRLLIGGKDNQKQFDIDMQFLFQNWSVQS